MPPKGSVIEVFPRLVQHADDSDGVRFDAVDDGEGKAAHHRYSRSTRAGAIDESCTCGPVRPLKDGSDGLLGDVVRCGIEVVVVDPVKVGLCPFRPVKQLAFAGARHSA